MTKDIERPIFRILILLLALILNQGCLNQSDESKISVDTDNANKTRNKSSNKSQEKNLTNKPPVKAKGTEAKVLEVTDGDTIKVSINGATYKVRYIGIDTPETKHPSKGVEHYGPEASAYNKKLVGGKTVRLVKDVSNTDKYNRLLRYIYVGDLFVNAKLVKEGYAHASSYPPDVKYADKFRDLERWAKENDKGLWAQKTAAKAEKKPDSGCEAGYSPCVPTYPPDLNCADIGEKVEVTGDDPHGLDRDGDGVGCESY